MKMVPIEKETINDIRYGKKFIFDMLREFSLTDGVDAIELVDDEDHYPDGIATAAPTWARAIKAYGFRMKCVRRGSRVFIIKLDN